MSVMQGSLRDIGKSIKPTDEQLKHMEQVMAIDEKEIRVMLVEILRRTMYPTKSGDYKSVALEIIEAFKANGYTITKQEKGSGDA